jgi:hypothetical protein
MNRKIVDYKKLTPEILSLLVDRYPDGYDDNHIITFKNANNDTIEAVEVRTEDTIYLVKVSSRLVSSMANYDEDDYDSADLQRPIQEIDDDLAADDSEEEDEE